MVLKRKIVILSIIALIVAIAGYYYFFIISPIFVSKPRLEKPVLEGNVTEKHVAWVVNELGGYKLQADAEIEFIVDGTAFSVRVKEGKPVAQKGKAKDPDLRIYANKEAFKRVLEAEDYRSEIIKLYNEGLIKIELLKPMEELVLKGYKAIYDELQR
jgi:hypothetical protein